MGERSTAVCYLEIYKVCHFYVNRNYFFDEMNIKLHVFRSMSIMNQLLYLKMKLQKDQLQRIFFQRLKKQQHFLKIIIEQIVL